jgi:hypothetical protein
MNVHSKFVNAFKSGVILTSRDAIIAGMSLAEHHQVTVGSLVYWRFLLPE